ncbi:hypothetical protein HYW53_00080 [Candidatus Giovannonibacteria bacterium]|nr:hypothetical protein [Candidatus Giovannonibacteria bacterium]
MGKLAYKIYVPLCVLGGEVLYILCIIGGYLPLRTARGTDLHHAFFETLPGFIWGDTASIALGAVYVFTFSVIFGMYIVWMHNVSIRNN